MTALPEMIASVLHGALASSALWVLVFFFWRPYRVECIRDKFFKLRHQLFEMAEAGKISFAHPGYRLLRDQLNRMLAHSHRLTGLRLLVKIPCETDDDPRKKWEESLDTLPQSVRIELKKIESDMAVATFEHVLFGSPAAFMVGLYRIATLRKVKRDIKNEFVSAVSRDAYELLPTDKHDKRALAIG